MAGLAMCIGAMVVLGSSRTLSARHHALPFLLSASLVCAVWLVQAAWLREPPHGERTREPGSALHALRDAFPGREGLAPRFFATCVLFQMGFSRSRPGSPRTRPNVSA
jgi:hypothetical protein